jgi:hypothetical protein
MEPTFAPFERLHCSTEHLGKHALRINKLRNRPGPIVLPPMQRLSRQRRQQTGRSPELAA